MNQYLKNIEKMISASEYKPEAITVIGKYWYGSNVGTPYMSVRIYHFGQSVAYIPMEYGGYDMHRQVTFDILEGMGLYSENRTEHGQPVDHIQRYEDRLKILFVGVEVPRMKDL